MGLHRAFPDAHITGVDTKPQPNYPFNFIQADALTFPLEGYDLIWASPPCQGYSVTKSFWKRKYLMLIPIIRNRLEGWGGCYVIENVPGAPLKNAVLLCGTMFGLNIVRHRLFECRPPIIFPPFECYHYKKVVASGREPNEREFHSVVGHHSGVQKAREAMGIDWMTQHELSQAVPPAYSEFIGTQLAAL